MNNENIEYENIELMLCQCSSCEHQAIFEWHEDDNNVYMVVHLASSKGFWARCWHALKYMFGYRCCYGDFDEVILKKEDADKLQKVVDHLRKCNG